MAVAAAVFDETQRATLEALCETFVPSVETDSGDPLEQAFMARSALDMQVPAQIEGMLAEAMTPEEIAEVAGLLDALTGEDLARCRSRAARRWCTPFRDQDPEAKLGLDSIRGLTLLLFYALPDDDGRNPNWEAMGYPGPVSAGTLRGGCAEDAARRGGERRLGRADRRRRGRGLGRRRRRDRGAARRAGKEVLVLEMGGYRNDGFQPARAAGHAGALLRRRAGDLRGRIDFDPRRLTLGGGTVVNYMNCIPTPGPSSPPTPPTAATPTSSPRQRG